METHPALGVAVVDTAADDVIIWHVEVAPCGITTVNRLSGAWVLPNSDTRIPSLVAGRTVLSSSRARGLVIRLGAASLIEPVASLSAVRAVQEDLQAAFDSESVSRRTHRRSPTWPVLPNPTGPWTPGRREVVGVLAASRWLADLAIGWTKTERQRILRPYLKADGGPHSRPLPLALTLVA